MTESLQLACGQCVGCKLRRSQDWAVRCVHEAQLHKHSIFATFTYDEEHVPVDYQLDYRDFQLFLKRLRKHFGQARIRFYMCGEYGTKLWRPHFHACLFGVRFDDTYQWKKDLVRSPTLDRLWGKGIAPYGAVTLESAAYVARYMIVEQERYVIDEAGALHKRVREFTRMSLRPGIGARWLERFSSDVYPDGEVVVNGALQLAPRYYDVVFSRSHPDVVDEVRAKRAALGFERWADNTPARREVREVVAKARLSMKRRVF